MSRWYPRLNTHLFPKIISSISPLIPIITWIWIRARTWPKTTECSILRGLLLFNHDRWAATEDAKPSGHPRSPMTARLTSSRTFTIRGGHRRGFPSTWVWLWAIWKTEARQRISAKYTLMQHAPQRSTFEPKRAQASWNTSSRPSARHLWTTRKRASTATKCNQIRLPCSRVRRIHSSRKA